MAGDLFLGADTGGTGIKYVVTDTSGVVIEEGEVATDPQDILLSMERLADSISPFRSRIKALGMACAGIIDPVRGTLGRSPNLPGWQNLNLVEMLADSFGELPIILANDVNAALFGELHHGAGRGCANLVMIALGTGVGGGVVLGGKLHTGSHHSAGEIGHTMLDPNGPVCTCGNPGCLEAYAGSVGLLRRARLVVNDAYSSPAYKELIKAKGDELTTRDLSALATNGDGTAREVFAWAGRRLGQAVGNIINILNPDRVIIGGGVARAGDLILEPCRQTFPEMVLGEEASRTPVVTAELGHLAAAVGAADLARKSREGAGPNE